MKKYFVLITGASKGFGRAMALEFARRNINLVLVALPNSGLKELSVFIKSNFHVQAYYLEYDLSLTESLYAISDFIYSKDIRLKYLVNNAGILSRGFFDELSNHFIISQIQVNVTAPTLLTSLMLDNLKENAPSSILNVSSLASFFPLPKKQVYCGTKSYLTAFSSSLSKELKKDNISVTTICPGGLNTTSRLCYQNRIVGWLTRKSILNPEDAAKISINSLMRKRKVVVPGFINKCLIILDKVLPEFIKDYLTVREINKISALH